MTVNRTETAVGSPYFAPEGLLASIKEVSLVLEDGGEKFHSGPLHRPRNIHLAPDLVIKDPYINIEIDLAQISSGAKILGIDTKDIELLVLARNYALRRVEPLLRERIDKESPSIFRISGPQLLNQLKLGQLTRITISAYVVVARESKSNTFFPPPVGTWIAGNGFSVQPPLETFEFVPNTLDADAAARLNIPYDSFTHVEFLFDEANEPLTSQADANLAFRVYVNESIQNALIKSNKMEFRQSLVGSIMTSVVPQLIFQLQRELLEDEAIDWATLLERRTIATRLIESLRGNNLPERYLELVKVNPARAIAIADSQLQTSKKILGVEE